MRTPTCHYSMYCCHSLHASPTSHKSTNHMSSRKGNICSKDLASMGNTQQFVPVHSRWLKKLQYDHSRRDGVQKPLHSSCSLTNHEGQSCVPSMPSTQKQHPASMRLTISRQRVILQICRLLVQAVWSDTTYYVHAHQHAYIFQ